MSKARFLPAKWNIMNFLMCREMDNMIRAFSRPLKWVSKLLCLPETNMLKCRVLQPGQKMEEPNYQKLPHFNFKICKLSMEPPSWQQTAHKAITEQIVF